MAAGAAWVEIGIFFSLIDASLEAVMPFGKMACVRECHPERDGGICVADSGPLSPNQQKPQILRLALRLAQDDTPVSGSFTKEPSPAKA